MVMVGTIAEAMDFRREVGMGSSCDCLFGQFIMRAKTSASVAGSKLRRAELRAGGDRLMIFESD